MDEPRRDAERAAGQSSADAWAEREPPDGLVPDQTITCIDCGGRASLLTPEPPSGVWEEGDIVAYRCRDCLDRWDLVLGEPE